MRARPYGVLHVCGDHGLPQVVRNYIAVGQIREAPDQQVRQAIARRGAAERELPVGLLVIEGIELVLAPVEAERDLVLAASDREIVSQLVGVDVEIGEGAGAAEASLRTAGRDFYRHGGRTGQRLEYNAVPFG